MGVSACFYHPPRGQVHHALLNLHHLEHPHTGESIARCINQTLDAWGIREDKVLLIVTDNGSNIVKAVRLLRDKKREQSLESDSDGTVSQAQPRGVGDEQNELWMESEGSDKEDEEETEIGGVELDLPEDGENKFQRMPCLAHTLQLTLKDAILSPDSIQFDATPAGACLMDPSVSLVLQSPDTVPLKRAAQSFVQNLAAQYHPAASQYDGATARATQTPTGAPLAVLQKNRFLASRIERVNMSSTNQPNRSLTDSLLIEMENYISGATRFSQDQ
ncbi:hypothetical protein R3I94_006889 [Phoxinus phoxinus]